MSELNELINHIEKKFARLMQKIEVLEQTNSKLNEELTYEKAEKAKISQAFSTLETTNTTLRTTNALLGSEEYKRETKLKINSLIRDIDHCISQLSQ